MFRSYRWMALGAALFGSITVFAVQGCTVTTSSGPSDGGPIEDTNPPQVDPCLGCLYQQCYVQYSTCVQDTDCYADYSCAVQCTTGDCVTNCLNQRSQTARDKYLALANCDTYNGCVASTCSSTCRNNNLNCSQDFDAGTTPQSCPQCTDQFCSAQKANCASGTDCDQYQQCTLPCAEHPDDANCIETCKQVHVPGTQASEDLSTCTTNNCSSQCGF